jgi:putative PEP-CTERM system integral membrane protein
MNKRLPLPIRILTNGRIWAYGLFWSWNLIFLAFMLLGFAPQILPEMLTAVRADTIPAAFLVYAAILTAIPAVVIILGFTRLRHSPGRLFALGYGVEGPLMLLVATRFFVVRQVTPVLALILAATVLGIATYLWHLLDHKIDGRGPLPAHLRLFGLTLLLAIGLYISIWIAFYVVPLAAESSRLAGDVWRNLGRSLQGLDWRDIGEMGRWLPLWILGFILGIYTATLFVLMPVAVSALYARAWKQALSALAQHYSRSRAMALTTAVLIIGMVPVLWSSRQPQHTAFALLETPPASTAEAQALLQQEETIRNGLLNAYLAPQRYVSSRGEVDHVSQMYQSTFDMSEKQARQVQQLYEVVASPVLYQPAAPVAEEATVNPWENRAFRQDPQAAAELYEQFFDQPIVDGEKEAVVDAVRSTWSVDQALTNWQAVADREVHLKRQEINVSENGDWAEVELYEVYQNQTGQRQEVVYYFSLPESAVITGVWLGYSADRDQRFVYRVAPRGAAQASEAPAPPKPAAKRATRVTSLRWRSEG